MRGTRASRRTIKTPALTQALPLHYFNHLGLNTYAEDRLCVTT
ncbi:hypothetical protein [Nitrosomonas eutropha]|nr:hypothetical protein [Nitrosomonas eutropha]